MCRPRWRRRASRVRVTVIGAGVAGLACALELAERGAAVEVLEREPAPPRNCSWFAGGMLAPWCEQENSGALIAALGAEGLPWWRARFPATVCNGTLVVAHARDRAELQQFARRTVCFEELAAAAIAALEPDLADRFGAALYFAQEAHLEPRAALAALTAQLRAREVAIRYSTDAATTRESGRAVLDC
jgi:glycine oxidase